MEKRYGKQKNNQPPLTIVGFEAKQGEEYPHLKIRGCKEKSHDIKNEGPIQGRGGIGIGVA